jgi:hypothetical protein
MTRNKKSWLDRLDEIDQKAQKHLDKENTKGARTIFQKSKLRPRRQTDQEKTLKLTVTVYVFFIFEVFTLGGLFLRDSAPQEYGSSLASGLQAFIWLGILSIASVAIGVVALIKKPRLFYMHVPLIINCLLLLCVLIILI